MGTPGRPVRDGTVVLNTLRKIELFEVPYPGHVGRKKAIAEKYVYVLHEPGSPDAREGQVDLVDKLYAFDATHWFRFNKDKREGRHAWWEKPDRYGKKFRYDLVGYNPPKDLLNGYFYFFLSPLQLGAQSMYQLFSKTQEEIQERDYKGEPHSRPRELKADVDHQVELARALFPGNRNLLWWDENRASVSTRARFDIEKVLADAKKWKLGVALRDPLAWCADISTYEVAWASDVFNKYIADPDRNPRRFVASAIDGEIRNHRRTDKDKGLVPYLVDTGPYGWWPRPEPIAKNLGWKDESGRVVACEKAEPVNHYVAVPKEQWLKARERSSNTADLYLRLDDLRGIELDNHLFKVLQRLRDALEHPSTKILRAERQDSVEHDNEDHNLVTAESENMDTADRFWAAVSDPLKETVRGRRLLAVLERTKDTPMYALAYLERDLWANDWKDTPSRSVSKFVKKWFDAALKRPALSGLKLGAVYFLYSSTKKVSTAKEAVVRAENTLGSLAKLARRNARLTLLSRVNLMDRLLNEMMLLTRSTNTISQSWRFWQDVSRLDKGEPVPNWGKWYHEAYLKEVQKQQEILKVEQAHADLQKAHDDVRSAPYRTARAKARTEVNAARVSAVLKTIDMSLGAWGMIESYLQRKSLSGEDVRTGVRAGFYAAEAISDSLAARNISKSLQSKGSPWSPGRGYKVAGTVGAVLDVYLTSRQIGTARDSAVKWGYGFQTVAAAAGLVGAALSLAGAALTPGVGVFIYGIYAIGYIAGALMVVLCGYGDWKDATAECFLGINPKDTPAQQQERWMKLLTSFEATMDGNEMKITPGVLTHQDAKFLVRWFSGGKLRSISVENWRTGKDAKADPPGCIKKAWADGKIKLTTDAWGISESWATIWLKNNKIKMKPLELHYKGLPGFTTDYAKPE